MDKYEPFVLRIHGHPRYATRDRWKIIARALKQRKSIEVKISCDMPYLDDANYDEKRDQLVAAVKEGLERAVGQSVVIRLGTHNGGQVATTRLNISFKPIRRLP